MNALLGGVREELLYSLLIPSSNFKAAESMVREYGNFMSPLSSDDQLRLAKTFVNGIAKGR